MPNKVTFFRGLFQWSRESLYFMPYFKSRFGQVVGFVDYGGLFQRITLTILWCWITLIGICFSRVCDNIDTRV